MLFDFLCKTRIKEIELERDELYSRLRTMKTEIDSLKEERDKKAKRLAYLLNKRFNENVEIAYSVTAKGIEVFLTILINKPIIKIVVYNVNTEEKDKQVILLNAEIRGAEIVVEDIIGGKGMGHGTLAISYLFEIAKKLKIEKITGELKSGDSDHFDRLKAFYEKMGFVVTFHENKKTGHIEKIF